MFYNIVILNTLLISKQFEKENMVNLSKIYNKSLENARKKYREENPKKNNTYRPSSSGMCARKIYFESIEKTEPDCPKMKKS